MPIDEDRRGFRAGNLIIDEIPLMWNTDIERATPGFEQEYTAHWARRPDVRYTDGEVIRWLYNADFADISIDDVTRISAHDLTTDQTVWTFEEVCEPEPGQPMEFSPELSEFLNSFLPKE